MESAEKPIDECITILSMILNKNAPLSMPSHVPSSSCPLLLMSPPPHVPSSSCPLLLMSPPPHVPSSSCPLLLMSPPPHVPSSSCPLLLMSPPPHVPSSSCPLLLMSLLLMFPPLCAAPMLSLFAACIITITSSLHHHCRAL